MSNHPKIFGVLPVIQTPFLEDESIDFDTLAREVDYLFNSGADGITFALASELMRFSRDEHLQMFSELCRIADGRGTVTLSVGAETTKQAVFLAVAAQKAGADAVMAIPPVSTNASEEEKIEYYTSIHNAITIPLVVQDASGYLGHGLPVETQANLRKELGPRIYFKPEANPVGPLLTYLQNFLNNEGIIFEGSGGVYLMDAYWRGITGTMPGSDLIQGIVEIWRALKAGNINRAYSIFLPLSAIVSLQLSSLDAYLSIEKYLLVKQGVFKNYNIRKPRAYSLDKYTMKEVDRLYGYMVKVLENE